MPALPFKLNQDRRHHIPEQKRKVPNWRDYDESLRRRGSLTVWFSDEAVEAWDAERRTSRGGRVARIRGAGAMTPTPFWAHAMRADSGRPSSSMRFRTWTATSISV